MMLSQNRTVNYVVGGLAIASLALLAYTVTRPTRTRKSRRKKRNKLDGNKKKSKKYKKTFTKKPIDVHLVMENMEGFNAHVAGDKKNDKLQLKYGSRLVKINDKRVENLSYQEIFEILTKTKTPITLQFRQFDDLCDKWSEAEQLKEGANADFKNKKLDSAISKVTAAIQLHPTNKIYYSNRILMLLQNNQYQDALKDCQIIRELDPKSVYIKGHYLRGLTLLKLKKYKNAASAFQTVVKLNPEFKKAKDRLHECLKELKQDSNDEEKRISSKQEELKQTFEQKQDENDNKNENENVEESKEENKEDEDKDKDKDKDDVTETVEESKPNEVQEAQAPQEPQEAQEAQETQEPKEQEETQTEEVEKKPDASIE